jgi:hypothetical protein
LKYLRLYEEFVESEIQDEIEIGKEIELSDKTIDDVLSDDFFEDDEPESYKDYNDVYHIKNWNVY